MTKSALLLLLFGALLAACMRVPALEPPPPPDSPDAPALVATPPAGPTATASPTSDSSAKPTLPPPVTQEPESTKEPPISEVLPVVQPPAAEPTAVRGGTSLMLPKGTAVIWGGCASDGTCHWFNFYWAPTHEVVMQDGEGPHKVQHELCHAHQHWSINGGATLDPSDYDLESWYSMAEGQSFAAAVAGLPWPWTHSAVSGLEDFAWTCAYWYLDPAHLLEVSPERYQWAAANLP